MGSISRMARADRFIKEFGPEAPKILNMAAGKTLSYVETFLGQEESGLEQVYAWAQFQDSEGVKYSFIVEGSLYDPENDYEKSLAERIMETFNLSREEATHRLKRADLY